MKGKHVVIYFKSGATMDGDLVESPTNSGFVEITGDLEGRLSSGNYQFRAKTMRIPLDNIDFIVEAQPGELERGQQWTREQRKGIYGKYVPPSEANKIGLKLRKEKECNDRCGFFYFTGEPQEILLKGNSHTIIRYQCIKGFDPKGRLVKDSSNEDVVVLICPKRKEFVKRKFGRPFKEIAEAHLYMLTESKKDPLARFLGIGALILGLLNILYAVLQAVLQHYIK